ncbi:MAG TPA: hypothetical protein VEJ46_16715 [Candidatus Acidoferrum sp.]|nr:hypothetical protein [Candidatus Acidoferrum sp.]
MTRCLNCGAERSADVCDACGLGSAAAELSLRKRLLNRTALFVLGALAFVAASVRYPPVELDSVLIFIGALFFPTLGLAIWVERRALRHAEAEALKRMYYGLVPVPWLLAVLLLVNGALDRSTPQIEEARVVGKFAMAGALPIRRLVVTSWREGHFVERVPIDRSDFDGYRLGDIVNVKVQSGLVGIPWVAGVSSR